MAKKSLFLLLILLFAAVLTFTACGDDETTTTQAPTTTKQPTTAAITTAEATTTTAPITTVDPFLIGTPGLTFEKNGDGTAKVTGIKDKSAKTVIIPRYTPEGDRVVEIGYGAFSGNTVIETLKLPETVYLLGTNAFFGCESLKTLELSEGLEEIRYYAFYGCTALESVVFPKSVKSIAIGSFAACYNLKYLHVTEGNKIYRSESNCILLQNENTLYLGCNGSKIPKTVTKIAERAFYDSGITELLMPDSVVEVGKEAFGKNRNLVDVVLSEKLTVLDDRAFVACHSLKSLYLPASLTAIGATPFAECAAMERLTIAKENAAYTVEGLCLIEKASGTLIQGFARSVIPSSIKAIASNAFARTLIHTVTLPEGCLTIGDGAFSYCSALRKLTLPKSLTAIAPDAFLSANVIETIAYGGSEHAYNVLTAEVTLPTTVTVTYGE